MRFFVSAYPEDILDEGIDVALDRIHGELGATGLTLRVSAPAYVRLRARAVEARVVRSRGGVFFKTSEEIYQSTRCKPILSSYVRAVDPLDRIAESCAARGLDVRAAIHAATMGRMAERYPEAACKNVWDDRSSISLCLHNPDVQALLAGLVCEASERSGVTGIELRDLACGWFEAFDPKLDGPGTFGETARALISLCFCESCRQRSDRAGVDIASVKRFVEVTLCDIFEGLTGGGLDLSGLIERSAPFTRYMQWRAEERANLLDRLSERVTGTLSIREVQGPSSAPPYPPLASGDGYRIAVESDVSAGAGPQQPVEARSSERALRFNPENAEDGAALVSRVSEWARGGIEAVTLDDYSQWTETALTSIKQAVRFGRRAAPTGPP